MNFMTKWVKHNVEAKPPIKLIVFDDFLRALKALPNINQYPKRKGNDKRRNRENESKRIE